MNLNKNSKMSKTVKLIIKILGGSSPLALILFVVLMSAVAALLPIFVVMTMVGGNTVYGDSKNDLPDDVTIHGVDEWTEEEKKIFDDLTKEKEYYDGGFSKYNATGILKKEDDELDVSTPISTIHYQGTVNLTTFDDDYFDSVFNDDETANEYNDEKNVKNRHTRDFYKKAGKRIGNTFMIYPGMRMLLGNLVKNSVRFSVIECEAGECTSSTFSKWSLLGQITSSNETDASKKYGVSDSIDKITAAINYGESNCDSASDDWKTMNICYDTDLLFTELFGQRFSLSDQSIIEHLDEEYEATVPVESLINQTGEFAGYYPAGNYINVTVKKSINYDLYEKYLKEIFIPFVYINCDDCGYKDESNEVKEGQTKKVFDEIMQLTNSFKTYNDEDLIIYRGSGFIPGVTYSCGDVVVGYSADYANHHANDITSSAKNAPNIYPIMEGTVVDVMNTCLATCPAADANRYINGSALSSLSEGCQCGGGFGNFVKIESTYEGKTIYAIYAHLSNVEVEIDDKVTYKTILGSMGSTGVSTGRHLHLELNYTSDKENKFPASDLFDDETVFGSVCVRSFEDDETKESDETKET